METGAAVALGRGRRLRAGYEDRFGFDCERRGGTASEAERGRKSNGVRLGVEGARGECGEDKVEDRALKATQSGSLELGAEEEKALLAGGAL